MIVVIRFVREGRGLFESLPSEIVNVEFSTVGSKFFSFFLFFGGLGGWAWEGYRTETLCMHVENCKM